MSGDEEPQRSIIDMLHENGSLSIADLIDQRDQARADLAAAHTREAALRAAVEALADEYETEGLAAMNVAYRSVVTDLRRILDGTDQQPGDAT